MTDHRNFADHTWVDAMDSNGRHYGSCEGCTAVDRDRPSWIVIPDDSTSHSRWGVPTLAKLQEALSGDTVEYIHGPADTRLWVHEDARRLGLPPNLRASALLAPLAPPVAMAVRWIAGVAVVTGGPGAAGETLALTPSQSDEVDRLLGLWELKSAAAIRSATWRPTRA